MPPTIDPGRASISAAAVDAHGHLDAGRLDVVRAELEQQRRFRTSQLVELAADAVEAGGNGPRLQIIRVLTASAQTALAEIEAAMDRLADGSYGYCERCQEPILAGRLNLLPTSRLCTGCQYLIESGPLNVDRRDRSWPRPGVSDQGHVGEGCRRWSAGLGGLGRCAALGRRPGLRDRPSGMRGACAGVADRADFHRDRGRNPAARAPAGRGCAVLAGLAPGVR